MRISCSRSTLTALAITLVAGCASAPVVVTPAPVAPAPSAATVTHPNVTGNWVAAVPNTTDGTFRRTYFNLTQTGDRITGTVHSTQFFYQVADVKWDSAGGLTLTASMRDLGSDRRVVYDVKVVGPDE